MRTRRSKKSRGSTVVEVLMAITILAIGASGVVSLQKVTASSNRNSRSLAVANEISRMWVERLRADAMLWNHPSPSNPNSDLADDTTWLSKVVEPDPDESAWFRPESTVANTCGIHDLFGRDEACSTGGTEQGPFCVNLRLSWVREDRRMIRAEVRVFWIHRNEGTGALDAADLPCGDAASPPDVADLASKGIFRVVYATTAVVKNEAP
jgi:type IV pilus assembly protein PilV